MSDSKSNDDDIRKMDQTEKVAGKDLQKENEGEKIKKPLKNSKNLRRETIKLVAFKKRPSIQLSDGPYRMWLMDMDPIIGGNKKAKMLREVVLECFSKIAKGNLVPTQTYDKLCYWLDSDLYSDNDRVEDTTTLLHMIQ